MSNDDPFPGTNEWGTRQDWIRKQPEVLHLYQDHQKMQTPDHFWYYKKYIKNTNIYDVKAIVPLQYRLPLTLWHHRHLCHVSGGKLNTYLKKKYH